LCHAERFSVSKRVNWEEEGQTVIDFHCHALPWQMLPEPLYRARAAALGASGKTRGSDLGRLVERIKANVNDPDATLLEADLRSAGVDHAVLIGIDWGLLDDGHTGLHPREQLAVGLSAVDRSDGFFSFVVAVDPRRPDAAEIVAEAFTHDAVVGVKLYPPMGFWPDDPACDPVYAAASAAGRFAMFHTGRQSFPFQLEYGRLEKYGALQRRWPQLPLVLGHAGATLWGEHAIEVAQGHDRTYLEVSGWHNLLSHHPGQARAFLLRAWSVLGPDRVISGSDHLSGAGSAAKTDTLRTWWEFLCDAATEAGIGLDSLDKAATGLLASRPQEPPL